MIKTRPRQIPMHDATHKLRDEKEKGPRPKPGKRGAKPLPRNRGRTKK